MIASARQDAARLASAQLGRGDVALADGVALGSLLADGVTRRQGAYAPESTALVTGGYHQHARHYLPGHPLVFHESCTTPSIVSETMPHGAQRVIVFDWALDPPGEAETVAARAASPRAVAVQPGDRGAIEPPIVKVLP